MNKRLTLLFVLLVVSVATHADRYYKTALSNPYKACEHMDLIEQAKATNNYSLSENDVIITGYCTGFIEGNMAALYTLDGYITAKGQQCLKQAGINNMQIASRALILRKEKQTERFDTVLILEAALSLMGSCKTATQPAIKSDTKKAAHI